MSSLAISRYNDFLGSGDNNPILKMLGMLSNIERNTRKDDESNADKIEQERQQNEIDVLRDQLVVKDDSSDLDHLGSSSSLGESLTRGIFGGSLGNREDSGSGGLFDLGVDALSSRKGLKGVRGLSKLKSVAKIGSKLKPLLRGGSKVLGPLAAVASVGVSAYDFFSADNSRQRKNAIGSGIGGLVGGALGAIGGPLGIAAGAMLGSWVGGKIGNFFSNTSDLIPDNIKKGGPVEELRYIDKGLYPKIVDSINSGSGDFDENNLEEINKYRRGLLDNDLPKYFSDVLRLGGRLDASDSEKIVFIKSKLEPLLADSPDVYNLVVSRLNDIYRGDGGVHSSFYGIGKGVDSGGDVDVKKLEPFVSQGMSNPVQLSVVSGLPLDRVNSALDFNSRSGGFRVSQGSDNFKDFSFKDNILKDNGGNITNIVNNVSSSSSAKGDVFRISDSGSLMLSQLL